MRQIHTRVLLTTGLLLCLILLSSPVSSNPVRPIRSATLERLITTTGTTLHASAPTDLPYPPVNTSLSSNSRDSISGINGMTIFWVIVSLSVACMTHPIGSACGLEAAYRHRIRIGPLMSIFDTLHLLYEIYHHYRNSGGGYSRIRRMHNAIREVVKMRLRHHQVKEQDDGKSPPSGLQTAIPLRHSKECVYNTPIRHLFSAVLILQYVKLCGFHGIPMSFSLATGYFVSWVIMEMILLIGEGRTTMDPGQAALPNPDSSSPPTIPKLAGRLVFLVQSIAILVPVSMLLLRAQSGFKVVPKQGETVPSFYLRFAVFLIISLSRMYWVDSLPLFVGISLMSGHYVSGHKNSRTVSDFIGLSMAIAYVSIITTMFYSSWIVGAAHLLFVCYIAFFYTCRLFWREEEREEKQEGCRTMARLEPALIFGSSALTYSGGLLFFYVFVFDPEGTWKAGWAEILP